MDEKKRRLNAVCAFKNPTGCRLLSFHRVNYNREHDGHVYQADEWWIAQTKEGGYGKIAGGANNIACFIGWVTGDRYSYCFNPIDIDEYIFCRRNSMYVDKKEPYVNRVQFEIKARYVFVEDSNDRLVKIVKLAEWVGKDKVVWERE